MILPHSLVVSALLAAGVLMIPGVAHAGFEACNDIEVSASAECELVTSGGCEAQCEPIAFQAACAGQLTAECDGQCSASASVECTASCEGECLAECEVDPPSFDCRGGCVADCEGSCMGRCDSGDSECAASCRGTCGAHCDVECEATPGSAECAVKCEASCSGSCEAEANLDCQIDCQADGFVECEAELKGGCEVQCTQPEGALFCDGQYVDAGNNLQECIAALEAGLDIDVQGSASGECHNLECTGNADGAVSCAVDPTRPSAWSLGWFGALATAGFVVGRRRKA